MMEALVIGSDHYNTLGLVRSLGEAGYRPHLVLIVPDVSRDGEWFTPHSRYVGKVDMVTIDQLTSMLMHTDYAPGQAVLFPSGDPVAKVLDDNYDILSKRFHVPNIGHRQGALSEAADKEAMRQHAAACGFHTPRTWTVNRTHPDLPDNVEFPCVIKPVESAAAYKEYTVYHNAGELRPALARLLKKAEQVQVQAFIDKHHEILFPGWAHGNEVMLPCILEKTREYPERFGLTGMGRFTPDTDRYFPIERLRRLIAHYNYTGLLSIEFLVDNDGKVYFLEINFRNDGNGYFPGFGGVNLPDTLIQSLEGKVVDTKQHIAHPFTMMRELVDFDFMRHTHYPILKWIKDIRRADVFQVYNRRDPRPFRHIIQSKLKRTLLRFRAR